MRKCFQIRTFKCIHMSFLVSEINTLIFSFTLIKLISFPYSLGKKKTIEHFKLSLKHMLHTFSIIQFQCTPF